MSGTYVNYQKDIFQNTELFHSEKSERSEDEMLPTALSKIQPQGHAGDTDDEELKTMAL